MSSVDRDLETWQVLCRRMGEKRRMPETIQVYSKSLGSVTRVAEKAFDPAQAREIYKQLIVELNANGWTEEAHRLVVRLGETLSSAPSSTPLGGEGDQAEERSGWQNAD